MEAMAYLFAFMVFAALVARFGRELLPGRAGLALQLTAAALAAGLAIRAAGLAMDVVAEKEELFLVVVAGMAIAVAVVYAIFMRAHEKA